MTKRAALFLDRDGVVCRALIRGGKPFPPRSLQELDILPGVKEALQEAGAQKLVRIIVTNQPDVARGTLARDVVDKSTGEVIANANDEITEDMLAKLTKMDTASVLGNGGGTAHNNLPPYLALSFIIALQGIFPPRP